MTNPLSDESRTKRSPTGFLWWVAAFSTAMTLAELWERDLLRAGSHAALAIFLAIQAWAEGSPRGPLRIAQWSALAAFVGLAVVRFTQLAR